VDIFTKESLNKYESLSESVKKQVLFIPFEKFAESPNKYLELISNLIRSEVTKKTTRSLKKQRVPRKIDVKDKERKLKFIKKNTSSEYFQILNTLAGEYESRYLIGKR
jgi:hypothetical protein